MAESPVRTDKRFQLTVLGGIAAVAIVFIGVVQIFLVTSIMQWASIVLLLLILASVAYLAVDL